MFVKTCIVLYCIVLFIVIVINAVVGRNGVSATVVVQFSRHPTSLTKEGMGKKRLDGG